MAEDIIECRQDHEHEQQHHADLQGGLLHLLAQWLAGDGFQKEEKDVPAVEDRNGQQVQDAKIYADQGGQGQQVDQAVVRFLVDQLADGDDAAPVRPGRGGRAEPSMPARRRVAR